ncbi:hypothetical protein [Microbacterium deminutum]|uniref:Uncharacterized protein n=1 Tax=Microbacterium deminutum TaxID=344164 RepID=A0ABP5BT57_9MICO
MDWRDLAPDERLTYLIGDIVRADVLLEGESGVVLGVVARESPIPPAKAPGDLANLLEAIKDTLRGVELADFPREMARHATIAAIAAHKARNGAVHDRWMHHWGEGERWTPVAMLTTRPSPVEATPQNLDSFLKCRDDLIRAAWRMRGVGLVLPMWLGVPTFLDHVAEHVARRWTAVALGYFSVSTGHLEADQDAAVEMPPRASRGKNRLL